MSKKAFSGLLLLLAVGGSSPLAAGGGSAPGDPDPTLNGSGWVTVTVVSGNDAVDGAALPSGRFVYVFNAPGTPAVTWLATAPADGSGHDSQSFALSVAGQPVSTIATSLALQPDGKVVVAGFTGEIPSRGFLLRATISPTFVLAPDAGFGTAGFVLLSAVQSIRLNDVAIDSQGRIVAAGGTDTAIPGNSDFFVVRLEPNGTPDNGFDGDGRKTFNFTAAASLAEEATGVAIDASDRPVIVGRAATSTGGEFAIARLLELNGAFDPDFSGDGKVLVGFDLGGDDADQAEGVAIDGQGRILVAGRARDFDASGHVAALLRLTAAGVPDVSFNDDGRVTTLFGLGGANDSALGYDVLVTRGGQVLLLGVRLTLDLTASDLGAAAFSDAGNFDATFGFLGTRVYDFGGYETVFNATLFAGRPLLFGDQNQANLIARIHLPDIFSDGFESGGTEAWSVVVP